MSVLRAVLVTSKIIERTHCCAFKDSLGLLHLFWSQGKSPSAYLIILIRHIRLQFFQLFYHFRNIFAYIIFVILWLIGQPVWKIIKPCAARIYCPAQWAVSPCLMIFGAHGDWNNTTSNSDFGASMIGEIVRGFFWPKIEPSFFRFLTNNVIQ